MSSSPTPAPLPPPTNRSPVPVPPTSVRPAPPHTRAGAAALASAESCSMEPAGGRRRGGGWRDRQMEVGSRHVMRVTLALSWAHACTRGNVRYWDWPHPPPSCFLSLNVTQGVLAHIFPSFSPLLSRSISACNSPAASPPCQLPAPLLSYTDCNALLFFSTCERFLHFPFSESRLTSPPSLHLERIRLANKRAR